MSNNLKCTGCGSTDIDVDPSRADAVCTNCGNVLESSIIVSDIQFEENAHGGSSAIGTFVSSESKGGASFSFGGGSGRGFAQFQGGLVRESREITLRNARRKIEALAQQLSLRRDRIDMAFHFFKLALNKHLTRGRPSTHVIAACVYITCRTESTPHMLIDFSDVLQIEELVTHMDHQSLASPSRPDTSNPAAVQRNTTVNVVIDIPQFKAESA